ncbi:MAG: S-adenosylmethionine decarboxylase [bacterium]
MHRFHYIFDAKNIDVGKLNDEDLIKKILLKLVDLCEMKVLFGPVVARGMDYNPGFSAFAIIDFSHISMHTFSETKEMAVDIFSCKSYDPLKVKNYLLEAFAVAEKDVIFFEVKYPE